MKVIEELNVILSKNAFTRQNGKPYSQRSTSAAGENLRNHFRDLYGAGHKLEDPRNIGERHIKVLCERWWERKLAPKTMQGYLSTLRIFCGWIGKAGLVKSLAHYLPHVPPEKLRTKTYAEKSKSWAENGVDVAKVVAQAMDIDRRFGLMLMMQVAFGLRRIEVLSIQPWKAHVADEIRLIKTKNGKKRTVYIDTEMQRQVLEMVQSELKQNEHLGWHIRPDNGERATLQYSEAHYAYLLRKLGITRAETNCTGHSLRAQYVENAGLLSGFIPKTLGGTRGQMPRAELEKKMRATSELLGHSRLSVTTAYFGKLGRDVPLDPPGRSKAVIEECLSNLAFDKTTGVPEERLLDCMKLSNEMIGMGIYGADVRQINILWAHHSRRHACDWLPPSETSNQPALEAAAISIMRKQDSRPGDNS